MEKIVFTIPPHLLQIGVRECTLYGCDKYAFFASKWAQEEKESESESENLITKYTFACPNDFFYLASKYTLKEVKSEEFKNVERISYKAEKIWTKVREIARLTGELWLNKPYKTVGTMEYTSVYVRIEDEDFLYGPIFTQHMGLQVIASGEFNSRMLVYDAEKYFCDEFRLAAQGQTAYIDLATSNPSFDEFDKSPNRFDAPNHCKFIYAKYYQKEAVFSFATPGFGYAVKNEDGTYRTYGADATARECLRRLKWGRWDFHIDPGEIPRFEPDFPYANYWKKIYSIENIF